MFKHQWQEIHQLYDVQVNRGRFEIPGSAPKLEVRLNTGKRKGETAVLRALVDGRAEIEFADGTRQVPAYAKVTLLDENGEPDEVLRDMLDEPIQVDSWVTYSIGTRHSHSMGIGRVTAISDLGNLQVRQVLIDGKPLGRWDDEKRTVDHRRCVKLPSDPKRLMFAIMTDFESVQDGRYDDAHKVVAR